MVYFLSRSGTRESGASAGFFGVALGGREEEPVSGWKSSGLGCPFRRNPSSCFRGRTQISLSRQTAMFLRFSPCSVVPRTLIGTLNIIVIGYVSHQSSEEIPSRVFWSRGRLNFYSLPFRARLHPPAPVSMQLMHTSNNNNNRVGQDSATSGNKKNTHQEKVIAY